MERNKFTNPVWTQDFPDPHILSYRSRYYAYATETGRYGSGFQVMESKDLVHWTHRGTAFAPPWSSEHLWAPEVIAHRGLFYMTFSAKSPRDGKHHIGIATASNPLGPFKNRTILVRGDENQIGVIDATIFIDSDGTPYLLYSAEAPRRILVQRLSADLSATVSPPREILRPDLAREHGVVEAPTLVKYKGEYVLFFSGGAFQSDKNDATYAVYYARAKQLTGRYVKGKQALVKTVPGKVYGPGHQCVVHTPQGEWWMLYHAWDNQGQPQYGSNPRGRTLRLDRLVWENGIPKVTGPSTAPQFAPNVG